VKAHSGQNINAHNATERLISFAWLSFWKAHSVLPHLRSQAGTAAIFGVPRAQHATDDQRRPDVAGLRASRRGARLATVAASPRPGSMLEDLMDEDLGPLTLFQDNGGKRTRLMTAMDAVNRRFGKFTAVPAVQGFKREWSARSESRSPNYTTRLAEVPSVRA